MDIGGKEEARLAKAGTQLGHSKSGAPCTRETMFESRAVGNFGLSGTKAMPAKTQATSAM